jgi:hypothetical protein
MKLTKQRIKQLIKEELQYILKEQPAPTTSPRSGRSGSDARFGKDIVTIKDLDMGLGQLEESLTRIIGQVPMKTLRLQQHQLREQQEVSPCGKKPLWPGDAKASRKVDPSGDVLKDQRAWYKCKKKGTKLPAGYPFSPKNSDVAAAGQTGPADILARHPKPPKSTSPSAPSKTPREQPFRRAALSGVKDPIGKLESQLGDINAALQALLKIGKIDAETVNKIKAALDGASALMLKAKG